MTRDSAQQLPSSIGAPAGNVGAQQPPVSGGVSGTSGSATQAASGDIQRLPARLTALLASHGTRVL